MARIHFQTLAKEKANPTKATMKAGTKGASWLDPLLGGGGASIGEGAWWWPS